MERNELVDFLRHQAKVKRSKRAQTALAEAANMLEQDGPLVVATKEMHYVLDRAKRETDQVRAELELANATIVHLANSQRGLSESLKLEIRSRK